MSQVGADVALWYRAKVLRCEEMLFQLAWLQERFVTKLAVLLLRVLVLGAPNRS
jgi:hypothetical protein